jgi:uncharacterized membrane protein
MKKRNAIVLTIVVLILGFILNFLFEIMPDGFKESITGFSGSIGLSYTLFWIICTLLIAVVMLFFVWKQTLTETDDTIQEKQSGNIERQTNITGDKTIYIEKNNGNITVE